MASIQKHGVDTLYYIRHNLRDLPADKRPSNAEIDDTQTKDNYSLLSRGKSAEEINAYRKEIEQEIYHYNRKNLVHSVEIVITLPEDCIPDHEKDFFHESLKYVVSTLPMGKKCVFLAIVHKDEGEVQKDGVIITRKRPHLHIMYIPAVKDSKHEDFEFKLCADQLTKKSQIKSFHPNLQKWLDKAGIKATVYSGVTGGKNISVETLKAITKETGLTLDQIRALKHDVERLENKVKDLEEELRKEREKEWGKTSFGTTKEKQEEKLW